MFHLHINTYHGCYHDCQFFVPSLTNAWNSPCYQALKPKTFEIDTNVELYVYLLPNRFNYLQIARENYGKGDYEAAGVDEENVSNVKCMIISSAHPLDSTTEVEKNKYLNKDLVWSESFLSSILSRMVHHQSLHRFSKFSSNSSFSSDINLF